LTYAPNGNNSLSPSKRGEGWLVAPKPGEGGGEGFVLVIGLLPPALSSLREAREKKEREKKGRGGQDAPR